MQRKSRYGSKIGIKGQSKHKLKQNFQNYVQGIMKKENALVQYIPSKLTPISAFNNQFQNDFMSFINGKMSIDQLMGLKNKHMYMRDVSKNNAHIEVSRFTHSRRRGVLQKRESDEINEEAIRELQKFIEKYEQNDYQQLPQALQTTRPQLESVYSQKNLNKKKLQRTSSTGEKINDLESTKASMANTPLKTLNDYDTINEEYYINNTNKKKHTKQFQTEQQQQSPSTLNNSQNQNNYFSDNNNKQEYTMDDNKLYQKFYIIQNELVSKIKNKDLLCTNTSNQFFNNKKQQRKTLKHMTLVRPNQTTSQEDESKIHFQFSNQKTQNFKLTVKENFYKYLDNYIQKKPKTPDQTSQKKQYLKKKHVTLAPLGLQHTQSEYINNNDNKNERPFKTEATPLNSKKPTNISAFNLNSSKKKQRGQEPSLSNSTIDSDSDKDNNDNNKKQQQVKNLGLSKQMSINIQKQNSFKKNQNTNIPQSILSSSHRKNFTNKDEILQQNKYQSPKIQLKNHKSQQLSSPRSQFETSRSITRHQPQQLSYKINSQRLKQQHLNNENNAQTFFGHTQSQKRQQFLESISDIKNFEQRACPISQVDQIDTNTQKNNFSNSLNKSSEQQYLDKDYYIIRHNVSQSEFYPICFQGTHEDIIEDEVEDPQAQSFDDSLISATEHKLDQLYNESIEVQKRIIKLKDDKPTKSVRYFKKLVELNKFVLNTNQTKLKKEKTIQPRGSNKK